MIKIQFVLWCTLATILVGCNQQHDNAKDATTQKEKNMTASIYTIKTKMLDGSDFNWMPYQGKRLMIVNVASECGLTPQYEKLQAMHAELDTSKYAIIGVPANNFLKQEPGEASDIASFCKKNYGVEFPILEKMSVGDKVFLSYPPKAEKSEKVEISPLYAFLTQKANNGNMDIVMKWNFQKIFVNEKGEVYDYADPSEIDPFVLLNKLAFTN